MEARLTLQMEGRVPGAQLDLVSYLRQIVETNLQSLTERVCETLERWLKDMKRFTYYKLKQRVEILKMKNFPKLQKYKKFEPEKGCE